MKITLMAVLTLLPNAVKAQECQSYLGNVINPVTFSQAVDALPKVAPKDEYESTSSYNSRQQAAQASVTQLIIGKKLEMSPENDFLVYDADRAVLLVKSFALNNMAIAWDSLWEYGGPMTNYTDYPAPYYDQIAVGIASSSRVTGTYMASNAFGAKTQVSKIYETQFGIYDYKSGKPFDSKIFVDVGSSSVIGEIPLSPDDAKVLKATASVAFSIIPKFPYYINHVNENYFEATMQVPRERTVELHAIFADIKCGMLLDATRRVVATFPVR